ncbi:MAG: leucine-rich repeat domain-containing protein [Bacteroidales bacterium]|nr:leucine-rich repeat domain-containing protein [Bacteroidales bacterium]
MKQNYLKRLALAAVLLLVAATASAYDFVVDGIYYVINFDHETVSVTNPMPNPNMVTGSDWYVGDYDIPETVEYEGRTYTVTAIGYCAFAQCQVKTVKIPQTVTKIEYCAFIHSSLELVYIPDGVTEIGYEAFADTKISTFILPTAIKSLESAVFHSCSNLKRIFVPDLDSYCKINFTNEYSNPLCNGGNICDNYGNIIPNIELPESVTKINDYAFSRSAIESIHLGENVTSIGKKAFSDCANLHAINIPSSLTEIGKDAFKGCTNFTEFEIPDLSMWYNINFGNYNSNLCYVTGHYYHNGEEINELTIPDDVDSIGAYSFYNCATLSSLHIGDAVTSIGDGAFNGCTGLTSLHIGDAVTAIGANAFNGCTGLTSLHIGDTVTAIGANAFNGCTGLTSLYVGKSIKSLGNVFSDLKSLKKFEVGSLSNWCRMKFTSGSQNPIYYSQNLYCNGEKVKELVIPEDVDSIGNYTFCNCASLSALHIGDAVTSIGDGAFKGCAGLTSLYVGKSIKSLGNVFSDLKSLKKFEVGSLSNWCRMKFTDALQNPIY